MFLIVLDMASLGRRTLLGGGQPLWPWLGKKVLQDIVVLGEINAEAGLVGEISVETGQGSKTLLALGIRKARVPAGRAHMTIHWYQEWELHPQLQRRLQMIVEIMDNLWL